MSAASGMGEGLRQRRLYGRRRGRSLRAGQRALIADLLPRLSIRLPGGEPLDPRRLFAAESGGAWLEIGFGAGENLIAQAAARPGAHFIGCEVFEPGIARLLGEIGRQGLQNIRIFTDDARLLAAALAPRSLAGVYILFPDPWPKERHKKRRIVSPELLDDLAAAMEDGAELRIATDDADYGEWIAERLGAHPAFAAIAIDHRPPDWPRTRYEEKAAAQGRNARLFRCRRRARTPA
jgi:tRNA (guanine-N7-)-methyltransferase